MALNLDRLKRRKVADSAVPVDEIAQMGAKRPVRREHLYERDARRLTAVEVPSVTKAATALDYCS